MTYQEIKNQLKALKEQNHIIPALNSKKEVLQAALDQILATIVETTATIVETTAQAIAPTTDQAIVATTATIVATAPVDHIVAANTMVLELDFTPARSLWNIFQFKITPDIKLVFEVVLYSIALCKFLAIKSTPHLIRAGKIFNLCLHRAMEDALKTVVVAGVLWQIWLAPKIQLAGYQLALWAVLIAIRIKKRGMAIVETTATIA